MFFFRPFTSSSPGPLYHTHWAPWVGRCGQVLLHCCDNVSGHTQGREGVSGLTAPVCFRPWGRVAQAMASGACGRGCSSHIRPESRDKEEPEEDRAAKGLLWGLSCLLGPSLKGSVPQSSTTCGPGVSHTRGRERISDSTPNIAEWQPRRNISEVLQELK